MVNLATNKKVNWLQKTPVYCIVSMYKGLYSCLIIVDEAGCMYTVPDCLVLG